MMKCVSSSGSAAWSVAPSDILVSAPRTHRNRDFNRKTSIMNHTALRVKIIGAGGYGGVGITELIHGHPRANISALVDVENVGVTISDIYPHLHGFCDLPIVSTDSDAANAPVDVTFMATPDGVGMNLARAELAQGAKVIDYSGDFRFNDEPGYADYASRIGRNPRHADPDLLPESVYGFTELHRRELADDCRIVGNPGCFAVSCISGLAPAAAANLLEPGSLICDCKTGASGAGKKPNPGFHYPARYEMMNAYKLAGHQHVCEVERELSLLSGETQKITFTSQVVPACRGIMSCLYGSLREEASEEDLLKIYRDFYDPDGFVRIYPSTAPVGSMHVRGTNYINLVVSVDARNRRLRVVSYIDNLVKGQAGSALQNMNVICGLPEKTGLDRPGQYP